MFVVTSCWQLIDVIFPIFKATVLGPHWKPGNELYTCFYNNISFSKDSKFQAIQSFTGKRKCRFKKWRVHLRWTEAKMYSNYVKWRISTNGVWKI